MHKSVFRYLTDHVRPYLYNHFYEQISQSISICTITIAVVMVQGPYCCLCMCVLHVFTVSVIAANTVECTNLYMFSLAWSCEWQESQTQQLVGSRWKNNKGSVMHEKTKSIKPKFELQT